MPAKLGGDLGEERPVSLAAGGKAVLGDPGQEWVIGCGRFA
jgi:hypothetical protein